MKFRDIVGHEKVKELFLNSAMQNKIGHAYILEGLKGVGKQSLARAFAAYVLCDNNKDGQLREACGNCKSCAMIAAGSHPDVRIVTNELYGIEKASKIIAVDTVREMKAEVYTKSYMGGRKFFIIPDADTMNVNAQNALLKVFEEPPENTTVILLCENSNALVQTIHSRAVELKLNPLSKNLVNEYLHRLKEIDNTIDETQINFAVSSANGSIGYAKELLQDSELVEIQNMVCSYILGMVNADYTKKYGFILFLKKNKDYIEFILSYMSAFLRDMLVSKQRKQSYGAEYGERLCGIYERISAGGIIKLLDVTLKYSELILRNVNYKTAVHCMVLEIWEIING